MPVAHVKKLDIIATVFFVFCLSPLAYVFGGFVASWTLVGNLVAYAVSKWTLRSRQLRVNGVLITKEDRPYTFLISQFCFSALLFIFANIVLADSLIRYFLANAAAKI